MTKFGKRRKPKAKFQKQLMGERQLVIRHMDKYNKLMGIGYSHQQAVKKLRKEDVHMGSLEKLKQRYELNIKKPGTTGITTQGIRNTPAVRAWIKSMVDKGRLNTSFLPTAKAMPGTLYYPTDIKLGRSGRF